MVKRKYKNTGRTWFKKGHKINVGRKRSDEVREIIRLCHIAEKNPMWKGDNVGYNALHAWVKRHLVKPYLCESCFIQESYDLTNISGQYKRDLNDWKWLCRRCHMEKDGRLPKLIERMKKKGVLSSGWEERRKENEKTREVA